jgi:hypothetical protein
MAQDFILKVIIASMLKEKRRNLKLLHNNLHKKSARNWMHYSSAIDAYSKTKVQSRRAILRYHPSFSNVPHVTKAY